MINFEDRLAAVVRVALNTGSRLALRRKATRLDYELVEKRLLEEILRIVDENHTTLELKRRLKATLEQVAKEAAEKRTERSAAIFDATQRKRRK